MPKNFTNILPKIIGISGTNGSGKDSLGLALQERYGYMFVSVTELLRDELRRRGLPIIRANMRMVSAEWRREFGGGVLVEKAISSWHQFRPNATGVIISSLRNPLEADAVHEHGGIVLWLDADQKERYQRVQANRGSRGGRKGEDDVTFEQFVAAEDAEMHSSGDEATLNMTAVKEKSDYILINDKPDVSSFVDYVTLLLKLG